MPHVGSGLSMFNSGLRICLKLRGQSFHGA